MVAWVDWGAVLHADVTTSLGFWTVASSFAALFVVVWACVLVLLRLAGVGPEVGGARRGTWALKVAMLFHHVPIACFTFVAICGDEVMVKFAGCFGCDEAAQRMIRDPVGPMAPAKALVPITIGYMVADLLLISQWQLAKGGNLEARLMVAHHILSIASWPEAVYYDFCARYVMILLMFELTSIFLIFMWMLSAAGLKKHPIYLVNGLLFTSTFVVVRMLGALPQLRALWLRPTWLAGDIVPGLPQWVFMGSSWLILPHILNCFWGVKVVSGFVSVLFGKGGKAV